jgi:hypothetical protein
VRSRSDVLKQIADPPDPPRTDEIIAAMRCCGDGLHGDRARGLTVVLWRAGLRSQAALDLVLVRRRCDACGFERLPALVSARVAA